MFLFRAGGGGRATVGAVPTTVRLDHRQIRELLTSPSGPVVRYVEKITRRATNAVQRRAPVDTGVGRASIRSDVTITTARVTGRIFMAQHMWYQARGTGIYGPSGTPIRPKSAKVLVFEASRLIGPLRAGQSHPPPGKRGLVFATEVKGTRPNHFLREGVEEAVPWPVRYHG